MKTLECSEKTIEITGSIYGERSKKLSAKYYQKANSLLNLGRYDEAIKAIETSIDIFKNPAEEISQ